MTNSSLTRTAVGTRCRRLCYRNSSIMFCLRFPGSYSIIGSSGQCQGKEGAAKNAGLGGLPLGWEPNPGDPFACPRSELAGAAGYERSG